MADHKVKVELSQSELWALICGFEMSYEEGPENELESVVLAKLKTAYRKFKSK